jgi:hypothetical protein
MDDLIEKSAMRKIYFRLRPRPSGLPAASESNLKLNQVSQ